MEGPDTSQDLAQAALLLDRLNKDSSEIQQFANHVYAMTSTFDPNARNKTRDLTSTIKNGFRAEIQGLEGTIEKLKRNDVSARHSLASSNLPYLEGLWGLTKQCKEIVSIRKRVCTEDQGKQLLAPGTHIVFADGDQSRGNLEHTIVDIIADAGETWIKVNATTSKRLIWDMTKLGWAVGTSDEESDDENDYNELEIYKTAKVLSDAAGNHCIRNQHPRVHLVLPRISEGEHDEADKILREIRKLGVKVSCSGDISPSSPLSFEILSCMAPNPYAKFSNVLNLDTSVLVGLISDYCHAKIEPQSDLTKKQQEMMASEQRYNFLPSWAYPALGDRELVCTSEAARSLQGIVRIMGTETEKARYRLLFTTDPSMSRKELIQNLRKLSVHDVPDELRLPIQIVADGDKHLDNLPKGAVHSLEGISDPTKPTNPTQAVFAYGWDKNMTTLTCNAAAVSALTRALQDLRQGYTGPWPLMWVSPTSRALLGTPKPEGKSDEQ